MDEVKDAAQEVISFASNPTTPSTETVAKNNNVNTSIGAASVENVSNSDQQPSDNSRNTAQSVRRRRKFIRTFPFGSAVAIFLVTICLAASFYTLGRADDNAVTRWPWRRVSPSVILSISAVLSNTLLRYLIFEGSAVTWWITALNGVKLKDLHWQWEFKSASGVIAGVFNGKFSRLAVATIAITAAAAHGALFQASVRVNPQGSEVLPLEKTTISVEVTDRLPLNWTGLTSNDQDPEVDFLTDRFAAAVRESSLMKPIEFASSGGPALTQCPNGSSCLMILRGVGLNWTGEVTSYNYSDPGIPLDFEHSRNVTFGGEVGFYVMFTPAPLGADNLMVLDVLIKDKKGCYFNSTGTHRRLTFKPATISYLIQVEEQFIGGQGRKNKTSALTATVVGNKHINPYPYIKANLTSPSFLTQLENYKELQFLRQNGQMWKEPDFITDFNRFAATYRGIPIALNNNFESFARYRVRPDKEGIYHFDSFGMLNQLMHNGSLEEGRSSVSPCSSVWRDPTEFILDFIDDLMFRSAVMAAKESNSRTNSTTGANNSDGLYPQSQQVSVVAVKVEVVASYQIRWQYAMAAAALPIAGILAILPTFWGFWRLDRRYTGSPVEVAEAFDTGRKFFDGGVSGKFVHELLKDHGEERVIYNKKVSRMMPMKELEGGNRV